MFLVVGYCTDLFMVCPILATCKCTRRIEQLHVDETNKIKCRPIEP